VASSRTVVIAGAGIGGLVAALTLAKHNFRVAVHEAAERLEETGAGIQLSPNAARILIALGLGERLAPHVGVPQELKVMTARSGRVLARAPLGAATEARYGAPYWVIHRGDLQTALLEAVAATPDIALHLGSRVEDFAVHDHGVTVLTHCGGQTIEEHGIALIGADGLWSTLRGRLGHGAPPRAAHYTAWRALVPAQAVPLELSAPAVNLWLGSKTHLVHYPVKAGSLINVVAILHEDSNAPSLHALGSRQPGWSAPGDGAEILARFPTGDWQASVRALLGAAEHWQTWALYDCAPLPHWGRGPITLLGDAAHPMLPYLAQGAAMAIEDAAVLADCIARAPDDLDGALRVYERTRFARTTCTQRAARRNGTVYHMGGAAALLRSLALLAMGGQRLIRRYDWLYGWTPA
jgi:2-polyprenyl-6-methoxyphenol hydroxylase-like FAD-dependent oxidoreductase